MKYQIELTSRAEKQFLNLPTQVQKRIADHIDVLGSNPRPPGCKKLSGLEAYRIRIGEYRVIYQIQAAVLLVTVIKIGHRREIYR